jgi:serine/threonine-protein kinase
VCDSWAVVTTLAGGVTGTTGAFVNGVGSRAGFRNPICVAGDASGNVIVVDQQNHCIRRVTPAGVVTTIAGDGSSVGFVDGSGLSARFTFPASVVVDANGNGVVVDQGNNRVRQVTPAGVVTTLVGSGSFGFADGLATNAAFRHPTGVGVDASGNIFVLDAGNQRLRKLTPAAGTPNKRFLLGKAEGPIRVQFLCAVRARMCRFPNMWFVLLFYPQLESVCSLLSDMTTD